MTTMSLLCYVIIILTLLWIYLFNSVSNGSSHQNQLDSIDLRTTELNTLYSLSTNDYHERVPGLIYDRNLAGPSIVKKELILFSLGDLLKAWNPDDTSTIKWLNSVAHPNSGHGLPRFDYSNTDERREALEMRDLEIPFILYNFPELDKTVSKWNFQYLAKKFGDDMRDVEKSRSNHFMYYHAHIGKSVLKNYPDWKPPQEDMKMTFLQFVQLVYEAELGTGELEEKKTSVSGGQSEELPVEIPAKLKRRSFLKQQKSSQVETEINSKSLHYLTISAGEGASTPWITSSLPFFACPSPSPVPDPPPPNSFFPSSLLEIFAIFFITFI